MQKHHDQFSGSFDACRMMFDERYFYRRSLDREPNTLFFVDQSRNIPFYAARSHYVSTFFMSVVIFYFSIYLLYSSMFLALDQEFLYLANIILKDSIHSNPYDIISTPSSTTAQHYLPGTSQSIGTADDVYVHDSSNVMLSVCITNGTVSPNELSHFEQPQPVQSTICLDNQDPSTMTGSQLSRMFPPSGFLSGPSPADGKPSGAKNKPYLKENSKSLRKRVMDHYGRFTDQSTLLKTFRKEATDKVASFKLLEISKGRRQIQPKFFCLIEGCDAKFTRKVNLESKFDFFASRV